MLFLFLELWCKSYAYYFLIISNMLLSYEYYEILIKLLFPNIFLNYIICNSLSLVNNLLIIDDISQDEKKYYCYNIIKIYLDNICYFHINNIFFNFPNYNYYCNNQDELNQLLLEWI